MLTWHHWAKNLHDAGYWPRRMKFPQELNSYVLKTKVSHPDGGKWLWSGIERDGLRHVTLPKTHHMKMTESIPARSSPETRITPFIDGHQDVGEKYATDGPKSLRARSITIGTWKVRSLRAAGKVEELTHEMKRYQWNILGLCEVRWKNFGETSTPEGHKLIFSGREDRHEHGAEFLIHKDTVNADQFPTDSLPFVSLPFVWRHHHLTSPSSKLMPQQLTTVVMTLKTSMINC